MLVELARYSEKYGLTTRPGFARKLVRCAIWLDDDGTFHDVLDFRGLGDDRAFDACPDLGPNELIAKGVTRSHFLVDTAGVVALLGLDSVNVPKTQARVTAKHAYFIAQLEAAANEGGERSLAVCAAFLRGQENLRDLQERLAALKIKPTDKVTFRVGDHFPVESNAWHGWWQEFRATLNGPKARDDKRHQMRCFQTGELIEPLMIHRKVLGLAGASPGGCVLIGFDKEAFTSYRLEHSENAAVSEEAASVYAGALNQLVAAAGRPIAGTLIIHWFKEVVAPKDDPVNWITDVIPTDAEAEELDALHHARKVVSGIRSGERPDLGRNAFYGAVISATGGRLMVRDWLEGNFTQLAENAVRWFEDLAICARDGTGPAPHPKLLAMLHSLAREKLDELAPHVATAMWEAALFGRLVPHTVVSYALQRIRADIVDPDKPPNHARMGLLKAYHIRKARLQGGEDSLGVYLNEEHPSAAYQAGRLMAVLANIQRAALGDVGAGVIQRYYASASTTPALVVGHLISQSQFHLNKLDRGLAFWYENQLGQILGRLRDGLPLTLDPEGQSLFALGYYQQLASLRAGREKDHETAKGESLDVRAN